MEAYNKKASPKPPNPRAKANPLSAITFAWLIPVFFGGLKKELEKEDLYEPLKEHSSGRLGDRFACLWDQEYIKAKKKGTTPSLLRVIIRAYLGKLMLYGFVLLFMECLLRIQQPFLIGRLVRYFEQKTESREMEPEEATNDKDIIAQPILLGKLISFYTPNQKEITEQDAYFYAGGVVLCSAINIFVIHPYMMAILHMGMKWRVACCSLIYRKSLRLSKSALGETTVGQLVNLLSNDVNRFDVALIFLHYLWVGPISTVIITYFMWTEVGYASIVGVSFMLAFIPLQAWLGKRTSILRLRTALRTDERVRLMNEIISGIQVIKMYTWEGPFADLVSKARKREIKEIRATSYIRGVLASFIMFTTRTCLFVSILVYVLRFSSITAEKVFVITSFYNILRQTMTVFFPQGIAQYAEATISIKRLQKFMMYEDTAKPVPGLSDILSTSIKTSSKATLLNGKQKANGEEKRSLEKEKSNLTEVTHVPGSPSSDEQPGRSAEKKKAPLVSSEDSDDLREEEDVTVSLNAESEGRGIRVRNATTKWQQDMHEYTLHDVTLTVKPGKLVAVIGPVGAGKSSLLNVLLKELPLMSGSVYVGGTVSYASQEPWLFAGSVRQNILFGSEMDRPRYNTVIRRCALDRDLTLLPHGDKTVVGERGFSLSGGQRARISLARAVYKKADVYLLDDPLSAVDTRVARHLFESCILGYLGEATRVLVTHQLQFLKEAEQIVIIKNGSVAAQGDFETLQASGLDFASLLKSDTDEEGVMTQAERVAQFNEEDNAPGFRQRQMSIHSVSSVDNVGATSPPEGAAESRAAGAVSGAVYAAWARAAAGTPVAALAGLFVAVLAQLAASSADCWTSYWVNLEELSYNQKVTREASLNETILQESVNFTEYRLENLYFEGHGLSRYDCIYIYTGIIVALVSITLARSFLFFWMAMRASSRLHNSMFSCITRAPMKFFHDNPSGRILNRFSKDMGAVDEVLPSAMLDVIQIGLQLIGIVVVVAIVNWMLLVPTMGVAIIFYLLRVLYVHSSRSIKRLEGITRSPVFSHLTATLQGITTIRAFGAQEALIHEFDQHQDLHSSAWYLFIATSRAFGFWLDVVCVVYIGFVTLSFLVLGNEHTGGNVGLAITQAMGLTGMFQWGMRQSTELENQMTSVERIKEYTEIESEPPLKSEPNKKPPPSWPENGKIEFKDVSLRYSEVEQPVLKHLNFVIEPHMKIGIVGRTGAGKSSLINALFRLAYLEGKIEIDGRDTVTLGLHELRSQISIIPQEPVLFSGTMRHNLDPFDEYPDSVLWKALEEVELREAVSELPAGLNSRISEGGSNFSVGQRQLVCLARAILRRNRILLLDEATANVDPQTDSLIQATIRNKFDDCTVLTIAHRLNTVMDSDKVLVMDAGQVSEFEHPHVLLQRPDSLLSFMVHQTGKATADMLIEVARESYEKAAAKNVEMSKL